MTFETFKKILDLQSEHYQKEQQLYDLGVETTNLNEPLIGAIHILWSELLTVVGHSWLDWYLYERFWISGEPNLDMKAWDGDAEIVKTIEELYQYLFDNSYFRVKN